MFYDCDKCGASVIPEGTWLKALSRGYKPKCESCRAGRLVRVQYGDDYCVPHQGLFSPDDEPLDRAGRKLYDSVPVCGKKDCIKESHYKTARLVKFTQERHNSNPKPKGVRTAHKAKQDRISGNARAEHAFQIEMVLALGEASVVASKINASKKAGRIKRGQTA